MSIAIAIPGAGLDWGRGYEPATPDGYRLQDVWNKQRNFLVDSASNWLPTIYASLSDILRECGGENWDGEGAIAIDKITIKRARALAGALFSFLPKGTPAPDVVPEADGEIGFSWIVDERHMFSLSVGEVNINFAGQFGKAGGIHGWTPIVSDNSEDVEESLEGIVQSICKLYPSFSGFRIAR